LRVDSVVGAVVDEDVATMQVFGFCPELSSEGHIDRAQRVPVLEERQEM